MIGACLACLALAGCDDSAKRNKFAAECLTAGFSREQCVFLAKISSDSDDAANTSAALSGMAIGLAATSKR